MIGKASGAQNAMSEYYGASSSDALDSFNGNTIVPDWAPGGLTAINPSGAAISATSIASRTDEHCWPVSTTDNKPHPFSSAHSPKAYPGGTQANCIKKGIKGGEVGCVAASLYSVVKFERNMSNGGNNSTVSTAAAVFALQKIKKGNNRFRFRVKMEGMGSLNRQNKCAIKIVQAQDCVAVSGGAYAVASGPQVVTSVFSRTENGTYDPISNPNGSFGDYTQSVDTYINTTYEWIWMEIMVGTSSYQPHRCTIDNIFIN
jgi:hypothetical protein